MAVTIGLTLGLGVVMATAYRANIAAHWEEHRCDPGVIPIAGAFKPSTDPRTAGEFAEDNWRDCQKVYIQRAVSVAAEGAKELADAQTEVANMASEATNFLTEVFVDVWRACYMAYSTFMDRMKAAAKLFQNTLVQMHNIIGRMQASLLAIVYALISSIIAFVDSVKVVLIVAIIVIGILVALQIILFFLFLPISGLIITMTFVLSLVIVAVATAIAAAMVSELFAPGACFRAGTRVATAAGPKPIEELRLGEELHGGARVSAIHRFLTRDPVFDFHGIQATGDHLVVGTDGKLIPLREHPEARPVPRTVLEMLQVGGLATGGNEVWCLTTTDRRVRCVGNGGALLEFADWEEIADDAEDQQRAWQTAVWKTLNGEAPATPISADILECDAALCSDAEVLVYDSWSHRAVWTSVGSVPLGAQIYVDSSHKATVVGRVEVAPDAVGAAVDGIGIGCWLWDVGRSKWIHPDGKSRPVPTDDTPWIHLYTSTGTVRVRWGGEEVLVRDASDVGLDCLGDVNDAVVLGR